MHLDVCFSLSHSFESKNHGECYIFGVRCYIFQWGCYVFYYKTDFGHITRKSKTVPQ